MGFADDLSRFEKNTNAKMDAFVKEFVGQISLSLITKSPVGDPKLWKNPKAPKGYRPGNFVANWRLGIGAIDNTISDDVDPDRGETFDNIVGSIPEKAGGQIYFITNSLPYAVALENGHSSKQAPLGMVTITALEYQQISDVAMTTINGRDFSNELER